MTYIVFGGTLNPTLHSTLGMGTGPDLDMDPISVFFQFFKFYIERLGVFRHWTKLFKSTWNANEILEMYHESGLFF